jgi:hypothetical protein
MFPDPHFGHRFVSCMILSNDKGPGLSVLRRLLVTTPPSCELPLDPSALALEQVGMFLY